MINRYTKMLFVLATGILFAFSGTAQLQTESSNPVSDPKAIVRTGNARFTVLTPEMIRMEWSEDAKFIDSQSLVFINRRLPVPTYRVHDSEGWLVIETDKLTLRYKNDSGEFNKDNLEISFELNGKQIIWHPGDQDTANLLGTTRTLDGAKGPVELDPGLLSRDGWALIDDSRRPLFDDSNWKWVVNRPSDEKQDWYFFGYGRDYRRELGDYVKAAGRIPMPPRFAFGSWWSRYWAYTDEELKDIVEQFSLYSIPLDVLVVDMDWHQTFDLKWSRGVRDQAGETKGWTGYTWDTTLFPNHQEFLKWCHEKGLKVVLNLHPASGVQPWEGSYPAIARATGVDPASKKYVPFDLIDKKFAENYFKIVLHPLEKEGVDFWWIDWQQWDTTRVRNLNPTWWLNYTFYTDLERENKARPLILARWGGLGDHRYEIGFSGDVITDWSSLQFQPYFTSTAANVGFGYWSHDIGGHLPGTVTPELYTRWVQWGAMSPILRTHTTRNAEAERRIWAYPYNYFDAMRNAFILRYQLLPYIYTASRNAYDTGVSIVHPLYYDYPENEEAYEFGDEYFVGNDLIVAPVVHPISPDTLLATEKVWVPPGIWIEWYSGERLQGPRVLERHYALNEIPILVRLSSVIPMQTENQKANVENVDPLVLRIFPGQTGSVRIYEDEGNSGGYKRGEFALTPVSYKTFNDHILKVTIDPAKGKYPGMKEERSYTIALMNVFPPTRVLCNSKEIGWQYYGDKLETTINTSTFSVHQRVEVIVDFANAFESSSLNGARGKIARLKEAMNLLNHLWPQDWSPDLLIHVAQTGDRLSLFPSEAERELKEFDSDLPKVRAAIENLSGDRTIINRALNHLCDVLQK